MYMNQLILALMVNSMELNVQEWKEIQIGRLFDIYPTKAYAGMSNDELNDGGATPFIINSAENNGIGGFCSLPATEKGNIITFSDTTDGNTFFYQPNDFIGFAHVQGMHPKGREWNKYQMIFMTAILMFHNRGLFNYGRKMRRDVISSTFVKVPVQHNEDGSPVIDANKKYSDDGYVPDWEFMENYIKSLHSQPITTKISGKSVPDLDIDKWEVFYLKDLFVCCMGNGIDASATTNNSPVYNYVSRDSKGNGVVGFVDAVYKTDKSGNIYEEKPFDSGTLTLALGGSFLGSCFVQKEPYYTAQNVAVLTEKESLSLYVKIFISTLIRNECKYKYLAFGRELNTHYKTDFSIKLPIQRDDKGNPIIDSDKTYSEKGFIPDWEFMENYIKSLPYSDRI